MVKLSERRDPLTKSEPRKSPRQGAKPANYGVRSIGLTLRILEALASSESRKGITELASELGTNKWRVFRYLHTLEEERYVTQDPETGRFELGDQFYLLTLAMPQKSSIVEVAHPFMVSLNRDFGHTVVVSAAIEGAMVILDAESGQRTVGIIADRGARLEFHSTAQGKIALAFGPESFLEKTLSNPLLPRTVKTITDHDELVKEIGRIRQQGWASAPEESYLGLNAVAAPILSATRGFAGSMAFVDTIQMLPAQPPTDLVEQLLESTHFISKVIR